MVGDNPRDDVDGAKAAGIRSILLDSNGYDSGADAVVPSIRDVPKSLRELGR
jgi:FMN phosphatase YigB (HAD superfamily)